MKMMVKRFLVVVLVLTLVSSQLISIATAEERLFYPEITIALMSDYGPENLSYDQKTLFAIFLSIDAVQAEFLSADDASELLYYGKVYVGSNDETIAVGFSLESKMIQIIYMPDTELASYIEAYEPSLSETLCAAIVKASVEDVVGDCGNINSDDIETMLHLIDDVLNDND